MRTVSRIGIVPEHLRHDRTSDKRLELASSASALLSIGTAYRFNIYHLMRVHNLDALFPLEVETL
jgi:hypothetical protein